ncbi:hypothetical protein ABIB86_000408 [Bradyrhizobium sp. JR1.7]|uniref:hypothetical protein n=1 Tax=unclassified Bradyrhizobium TaxID=2631580 RepID=UPI0033956DDA
MTLNPIHCLDRKGRRTPRAIRKTISRLDSKMRTAPNETRGMQYGLLMSMLKNRDARMFLGRQGDVMKAYGKPKAKPRYRVAAISHSV